MNNLQLIFIVCIGIAILVLIFFAQRKESFTQLSDAQPSNIIITEVDQTDHRTMVRILKGNSGKTVLLIHNNPATLDIWLPLFQTMQRYNMSGIKTPTLVAYDVRGHGTAWLPVDPKYNDLDLNNTAWTAEQFVTDCKKVYDTIISSGKVKVMGFGFGGFIAQKFALTFPELIEKLIILQTSVRPNPAVQTQINYLGGPNGWIARNPLVTYLTMQEEFANRMLCNWFYLPNEKSCSTQSRSLEDAADRYDDQRSPQYNLTATMWREGSATTTLQTDKLLIGTNLTFEWAKGGFDFPIHILAATDDPSATPTMMTETFTTIQHANRTLMVVFDIVNGKHGFTIMRPDYIAGIICDECEKLGSESTNISIENLTHVPTENLKQF